jgi:hypothetical protein
MATSKKILSRIKECIHNNELEFTDQVALFQYLGNLLNVKTSQEYNRTNNKSHMGHKFAKGTRFRINGIPHELLTDCD